MTLAQQNNSICFENCFYLVIRKIANVQKMMVKRLVSQVPYLGSYAYLGCSRNVAMFGSGLDYWLLIQNSDTVPETNATSFINDLAFLLLFICFFQPQLKLLTFTNPFRLIVVMQKLSNGTFK